MPRVSKRNKVKNQTRIITIKERKSYKVAVYARLSVDTDEKKNESLETQVEIISKYIANSPDDLQVYDIYKDLGKTGTNFERSGFDRMLQDVRMGSVNCIMVKDLSRFARNYVEAGNYIEKIFPFLGVRFIAVSDRFDTKDIDVGEKTMGMNIKNLVNEMYSKDFSKKAQVQIKQRAMQGIYVGGVNPYGYYTVKGDRMRVLYKEEGTSNVVQAIFAEFSKSHNIREIVRMLADMRANPSVVYQKTGMVFCPADMQYKAWPTESVKRILKNPIYLGRLVQGKTKCLGRNEKNRTWIDEGEWIISENTHEHLVEKKEFDEIQNYFHKQEVERSKREKNRKTEVLKENVFHDVITCGCCGRPMERLHKNERFQDGIKRNEVNAYICKFAYTQGDDRCESNRINESQITELLMELLKTEFLVYLNKKKDFIAYNTELMTAKKSQYRKELNSINWKIKKAEEEVDRIYRIYKDGIINSDEFTKMRFNKKEETDRLNQRGQEAEHKLVQADRKAEGQNKAIRCLLALNSSQILTAEFVNTLVDKIVIYPGKRVEIKLTYANELLEGDGIC